MSLYEKSEFEISPIVAETMIELIRALIGYPPDTKIISRVFDFCCAIHPPAEGQGFFHYKNTPIKNQKLNPKNSYKAYVTNTPSKFYFYPQFEKGTCAKSIQQRIERSQSLDVLESPSPKALNSAPKRIRSMVC